MAILGLPEFKAALARVGREADAAAREAIAKTAAFVEAKAKANFEGAHSKGEPHVGGDKPNVVTGALRRSITHDPIRRYSLGDYGTIVAPHMVYGRRVELGYPGEQGAGPGHQHTRAFPYFDEPAREGRAKFVEFAAETWAAFLRS